MSNMKMKRLFLGAIGGATLLAQISHPDFSGTWKLNQAASSTKVTPVNNPDPSRPPGPPPPPPARKERPPVVIEHSQGRLSVWEPSIPGGHQDEKPFTFSTDGSENVNRFSVEDGGAIHRSRSVWKADKLVTEWTLERDGNVVMRGTETRTLLEGSQRLSLENTIRGPDAIVESKWIYERME
jgi:hypothetical protein